MHIHLFGSLYIVQYVEHFRIMSSRQMSHLWTFKCNLAQKQHIIQSFKYFVLNYNYSMCCMFLSNEKLEENLPCATPKHWASCARQRIYVRRRKYVTRKYVRLIEVWNWRRDKNIYIKADARALNTNLQSIKCDLKFLYLWMHLHSQESPAKFTPGAFI